MITGISTLASTFTRSLAIWSRSTLRFLSSSLTVLSSSLVDCSSSLALCSSSFVLCSSSLAATQLLVGGGQLVGRPLVFRDDRSEIILGRDELSPEPRDLVDVARRLLGSTARPRSRRRLSSELVEQDQEEAFRGAREVRQRNDLQVDESGPRVRLDAQIPLTHGHRLGPGSLERLAADGRRVPSRAIRRTLASGCPGGDSRIAPVRPRNWMISRRSFTRTPGGREPRQQQVIGLSLRLAGRQRPSKAVRRAGHPPRGPTSSGSRDPVALARLDEDAVLLVQRREQIAKAADRLALPEKEVPRLAETVMQHRDDPPLQIDIEVDEHVAAADQIELGEGRVPREVVLDEDAEVANALADAVPAFDPIEELRRAAPATRRRAPSPSRSRHAPSPRLLRTCPSRRS